MKLINIINRILRLIRFLIIVICVAPLVICLTSFIIHTKKPHRKVLVVPQTINGWKKMEEKTRGYKKVGTCSSSTGEVTTWVKKDFNFSLREIIESSASYRKGKSCIQLFRTRKGAKQ